MDHSLDIFSGKVSKPGLSRYHQANAAFQGEVLARLYDPRRVTAVQAVTCAHPSVVERAVSGNGSGRCVLWAPEDV